MTYAFYYDAPGTPEIYRMIGARIGPDRPDGLLTQVVTSTDTGLRHLNVWQSREQWLRFRDAIVRPAVSAVLTELSVRAPSEPPVEHQLELVDVG